MAVINQELDTIQLPEHLLAKKAADDAKRDADDAKGDFQDDKEENLLSSSEKNVSDEEYYKEEHTHLTSSQFDDQHLSVDNQEHCYASFENTKAKSLESSSQNSKRDEEELPPKTVEKPKRNSKLRKLSHKEKEPEMEYLKILDVGNKDLRDKKDAKVIWTPNELRSDVTKNIRSQIKSAFGAQFEKDCYSDDFKKHIACLKLFET